MDSTFPDGRLRNAVDAVIGGELNLGEETLTTFRALVDSVESRSPHSVVVLVPAHNEEESIARTIEAILAQDRMPDRVVVICDNCTDSTEAIAKRYPITVMATVGNKHRKSGALNAAWRRYGQNADVIVCVDGDTILPPNAVGDWEQEFINDPELGGSSCQVVMMGDGLLPRIQRAEFAKSAYLNLNRGSTNVISGTGCAYREEALREVAYAQGSEGPWWYNSATEDHYLTYRIRERGWGCIVSPKVYAYTGSMPTLKALWFQRIKWQTGTVRDLVEFGVNRLTIRQWFTQIFGLMCISFWVIWPTLNVTELAAGDIHFHWYWLAFPALFSVVETIFAFQIKDWSWKDILLAASLVSSFVYTFLCMGWVTWSWIKFATDDRKDLWTAQYKAEAAVVLEEVSI